MNKHTPKKTALAIVRALLGEEAAEKLRLGTLQNLVEEQVCKE